MTKKEKEKKPFYKKKWVWFAVIIVCGIASGGEEETAKPTATGDKVEAETAAAEPAKK